MRFWRDVGEAMMEAYRYDAWWDCLRYHFVSAYGMYE